MKWSPRHCSYTAPWGGSVVVVAAAAAVGVAVAAVVAVAAGCCRPAPAAARPHPHFGFWSRMGDPARTSRLAGRFLFLESERLTKNCVSKIFLTI